MAWKSGPLPAGTWNWGGVVVAGDKPSGFYFADFQGDHCTAIGAGPGGKDRVLQSHEVGHYNNCLDLPHPDAKRL